MNCLPMIDGYTIDVRLKEFRKMKLGELPEFIPFHSEKGQELLKKYNDDLAKQWDAAQSRDEVAEIIDEMEAIEDDIEGFYSIQIN